MDDIAVRIARLRRRKFLWAESRKEWKDFYEKYYATEEGQNHLEWIVRQGHDDEAWLLARALVLKDC